MPDLRIKSSRHMKTAHEKAVLRFIRKEISFSAVARALGLSSHESGSTYIRVIEILQRMHEQGKFHVE